MTPAISCAGQNRTMTGKPKAAVFCPAGNMAATWELSSAKLCWQEDDGGYIGKETKPETFQPRRMAKPRFVCEAGLGLWQRKSCSRWGIFSPMILHFPERILRIRLPMHIFRIRGRMRPTKAQTISAVFY